MKTMLTSLHTGFRQNESIASTLG